MAATSTWIGSDSSVPKGLETRIRYSPESAGCALEKVIEVALLRTLPSCNHSYCRGGAPLAFAARVSLDPDGRFVDAGGASTQVGGEFVEMDESRR